MCVNAERGNERSAGWEESRTDRQRRYKGKTVFELGLPKRPVPYQRVRPSNKGNRPAK